MAAAGQTWSAPVRITKTGQGVFRMRIAANGNYVHVGGGGAPTSYRRSTDNGATWSAPQLIGENSAQSSRQARVQITAAGGYVFAIWQREGAFTGATLPADRIGYNRSSNGGASWSTAKVLLNDPGVNRNHQHVWMAPARSTIRGTSSPTTTTRPCTSSRGRTTRWSTRGAACPAQRQPSPPDHRAQRAPRIHPQCAGRRRQWICQQGRSARATPGRVAQSPAID